MNEKQGLSRLWILRLVPNVRFGRWLSFLGLFLLMTAFVESAGLLSGDYPYMGWPIALFFVCMVAYIIPVFHFVTERSQAALKELRDNDLISAEQEATLSVRVSHRSWRWVVVNLSAASALWFSQSWLLTGELAIVVNSLFRNYPGFVATAGPWLVWITVTCTVHALVDNARMFRKLAEKVDVDVLNGASLIPFGRMAVSSTLLVIGAQSLFSIMWLGGDTSVWTTIPGLVPTTAALVYLFFAPVWPLHKRLKAAKQEQLSAVQKKINQVSSHPLQDMPNLATLLTFRREVASVTEWPMDISVLARFSLYLVIVPLTWIGAALIENVVDFFIA